MNETAEAIKIHRGLRGVYFDRSPCTYIDGKAGDLRYRGYSIHDLAEMRGLTPSVNQIEFHPVTRRRRPHAPRPPLTLRPRPRPLPRRSTGTSPTC